ncbi:MAG: carbohydrate ABC transporter permease [Paenibacillus macerans]|uniref:carbohydrate ABC transporter permease n=1 Tax=Paenibacillus TaxID=44249 RepID=UPI00055F3DCB|nr:carbohydrate ABC transporter permease [Paenibacillus macerans]MBS5912176.1 carbohydrate ABC transporter permease [Paenibacillus macerans]MCY7561301.1 carbohydrate ABC transporter permease [Paenibacillus macerans]MDU5948723.1 carbohydrate ABC transporter permease [Paenibacillus macerans]MDU7475885.1 carbohydrate ABC transporter permease [Paenibacillus macerans]MEC0137401.1 carbohydrate ABC transporter permease [Paenibacillus macerans]
MLKSQKQKDFLFDSVIYIVLFIIMLTMLYPFYYVLIASFNKGSDTLLGGVYLWPRSVTLENYKVFLDDPKWYRAFLVTVARTISGTALGLLLTSLVAYALSHRDLLFSKTYFTIIIFAMYFSGGLIPYYVVLRSIGLLNSFAVYIVPSMLNTFFLLIAISFFREIPGEMKESAHMDGAGELVIFFRIILPVSTPVLATMALFMGVGQWNSWLDSAYFVQSENLRTLTYRMMEVINKSNSPMDAIAVANSASASAGVTSFSLQVTSMVVSIVPIICVYPFLQKYFVHGIMLGSVKG